MAMQISGVTIQGGMNILPAGGSPSPTPGPSDPNFSNVVFLFDGDGTNGADNNTFTDSSTNGYTVTESGSVIQGSFSPYGDNWSNYFDSSASLSVPDSTVFNLGAADFTIESWVNIQDFGSDSTVAVVSQWENGNRAWVLYVGPSNINFSYSTDLSSYNNNSVSVTNNKNEWIHVAVTRSGNTLRIFKNGAVVLTNSITATISDSSKIVQLNTATNYGEGDVYISNLRVVNGTAVYTSAFTPPTDPLTAITNTALLTCQSNRFIDNSSSGHTITVNGTPKVTPFSPFKDSDARSLATDGGSAYFDISNQSYLSYAGGSSTVGDITVSGWVYVDQSTGVNNGLYPRVFASGGTQFLVYLRDGAFRVYNGGEVLGAGIHSNTWYHFVVQRTSGTFELWLNGESQGTGSNSTNINLNTTNYVGTDPSGGFYGGYLTDLKVTEASEGYSGNFTPPTAPLTAIANTELLLNFQDAAIFDYSGINNIDTIGAQITTAVKKFGTGSVEFNGTGDELLVYEENSSLTFGTGDFTVEFWVYWNSVSGVQDLLDWRNVGGDQGNYITLYNSGSTLYFFRGTNLLNGTVTSATWHHIALTREDSVTRLFIDGTQTGSDLSDSTSYLTTQGGYMSVGGLNGSVSLDGYIDDLRITKGVARYTSNFTAPTAAFPTS